MSNLKSKPNEKQQLFIDKMLRAVSDNIDSANTNKPSYIILQGPAGTGKTFVSSATIETFVNSGLKVAVLAPTAAAMGVQANNASKLDITNRDNIDFFTVSSVMQRAYNVLNVLDFEFTLDDEHMPDLTKFLLNFISEDQFNICIKSSKVIVGKRLVTTYDCNVDLLREFLKVKMGNLPSSGVVQNVVFKFMPPEDVAAKIAKYDVIIIDEMPMVSDEAIKLLKAALTSLHDKGNTLMKESKRRLNATVVAIVGDRDQLGPVDGEMNEFTKLNDDNDNIVVLDEIVRSTDEIAMLGKKLAKGQTLSNVRGQHSGIVNVINTNQSLDKLIADNKEVFINADVVLTFTNRYVTALNDRLRAIKNPTNSKEYAAGDVLMVTANTIDKQHINSDELVIDHVYDNAAAIDMIKFVTSLDFDDTSQFDDDFVNTVSECKLELRGRSEEILAALLAASVALQEYVKNDIIKLLRVIKKDQVSYVFVTNPAKRVDYFLTKQIDNAAKSLASIVKNMNFVSVTFGFARTIHKSQGSEWKNVIVVLSERDLSIGQSRRLLVTGSTRAKENLKIFLTK